MTQQNLLFYFISSASVLSCLAADVEAGREKFWLPTVCTYQIHAVRWDIRFNLRNVFTYLETSQILLVILKLIIHTVSHIARCDGDVCNVMLRSPMLDLEWNCSTIVLHADVFIVIKIEMKIRITIVKLLLWSSRRSQVRKRDWIYHHTR